RRGAQERCRERGLGSDPARRLGDRHGDAAVDERGGRRLERAAVPTVADELEQQLPVRRHQVDLSRDRGAPWIGQIAVDVEREVEAEVVARRRAGELPRGGATAALAGRAAPRTTAPRTTTPGTLATAATDGGGAGA